MKSLLKLKTPLSSNWKNKLYNKSIRTIVHEGSIDRSFRIATLADLHPAQGYNLPTGYHGFYHWTLDNPQPLLRARDITKQFIIDLSHPQGYKRGHIPTAVNLSTELFDFTKPIDTFDGIKENDVIELLKYLGVSETTSEIILYDNSGLHSCRMWLLLRYYGVTNIRILNGGYKAWQRAKLPISEDETKPISTKNIVNRKKKREYLITKPSQMLFLSKNERTSEAETFKIIDTRDKEEFNKYHIPNAINIPSNKMMKDGLFENTKTLEIMLDNQQLEASRKLKLYSSQRFSACVAAFCFELIGRDVSVYDAGINNWKINFENELSDSAVEFLNR